MTGYYTNTDKIWKCSQTVESVSDCGIKSDGELHRVVFCIDLMPHYFFWIMESSQNTLLSSLLFPLINSNQMGTWISHCSSSRKKRDLKKVGNQVTPDMVRAVSSAKMNERQDTL